MKTDDNIVRIGPYAIDRKLGSGGMAHVYRGVHVDHGVDVAIKIMHRRFANATEDEQFRREVEAVAMLDHPNIIRILDFGTVDESGTAEIPLTIGAPFLVVEYADGETLHERMQRAEFGWDEARHVLSQLLDALAHAHARGIIHRDLKPENLLGFSDGTWKLADFGIATLVSAHENIEANPSGTPVYMSPEQFRGRLRETGPWSDLYSLGCVAFQLLSGAPPFDASSTLILARMHIESPVPPLEARFEVPVGVENWIARCLRKAPMSRFHRAADAQAALQRLGEPSRPLAGRRQSVARVLPRSSSEPTQRTPGLDETQLLDATAEAAPSRYEASLPQDRPAMPADWRRAARPARSVLDGTSTRLFGLRATPIVARIAERDRLWSALARVERGQAATVILRGKSGSGKTRLNTWLRERAHELGIASILHASATRSTGADQSPPAAIARHFMLLGLTGPELTARLDDLAEELDIDPRISLLVLETVRRIEVGDTELPRGWVHACALMLGKVARSRPAIVSVDDLHWASTWREFLREAPQIPGVMFLVTTQNEASAAIPQTTVELQAIETSREAVIIELADLKVTDCQELLGDLLRLEPILARRIAERAGGNPLFAIQLVSDWIARGWLIARPDGWRLVPGIDPELPDSLHQIWNDRVQLVLEHRPLNDRIALEFAALLGKSVVSPEWQAILTSEALPTPHSVVEALVRDGLATRDDAGWSFVHDMLRESILRTCRESGRFQSMSATVAERLQSLLPETGIAAARIGRHLVHAERFEASVPFLYEGAQSLHATGNVGGALDLLALREQALLHGPAQPVEFWRGELLRAQVSFRLRDSAAGFDLAMKVYEEATQLADKRLLADACALISRLANSRGEQSGTLSYAEQSLSLYRELSDPRGMATAHLRLGDYYGYLGEFDLARNHYLEAADLARTCEDRFAEAWSLWGLGFVDFQLGNLEDARGYLTRAVDDFTAIGDIPTAHSVVGSLADVERALGSFDVADELYARCESFVALSMPIPAALMVNRALLELARGRYTEARTHVVLARQRYADTQSPNIEVAILAIEACLAARAENLDQWQRCMEDLPAMVERINVVEYDFVWSFEQSVREAAGTFPEDAVAPYIRHCARLWRKLKRPAEAESLEALGRRL